MKKEIKTHARIFFQKKRRTDFVFILHPAANYNKRNYLL